MLILVAARLQQGPLRDFLNEEHFHDLGKLLFAFSTFWMYIWFSQYMLIWYSNIPEETEYFLRRQYRFWQPLFLLNVGLNWIAPFFLLLSRRTKRDPRMLAKVAAIVLAGRWVDLYLAIQPAAGAADPLFSLPEAGAMVGATAFAFWVTASAFRRELAVPLGDPGVMDSLHYHN
jgi:Ni/Fe-hydrogenase subunit HybB-like protein